MERLLVKARGGRQVVWWALTLVLFSALAMLQSPVEDWGPIDIAAREAFLGEEWDGNG